MDGSMGTVITAMVTPFDSEGKVDYEAAVELARYLGRNGSDAVVLSGTTGESPTLTTEEKLELFQRVATGAGKEIKIIAGTGGNCTATTIELTTAAAKTGVDGILLVTPYYNKPTQEGLYRHFKAVASSTVLPVILYNVPGRTGVNLTAATTLRLSEIDNVVAIKEAAGDVEQAAAVCRRAPEGFCLYSGDDSMTLPMLSVGAEGVISVASHLVGREIAEMIISYREGRNRRAEEIHHRLLPLFKGLFVVANPIPVKAAVNLMGIAVGSPRLPLLPLEEGPAADLLNLLKDMGLLKPAT